MRCGEMMKTLALLAVTFGFLTGCATMKPEASGTLTVECNVPDAAVLLDDDVVGRAGELKKNGKSLRPGFYRVELRQPGFYPFFTEINVPEGGATAVKAELHPLLD
jgi:hypothetical protein